MMLQWCPHGIAKTSGNSATSCCKFALSDFTLLFSISALSYMIVYQTRRQNLNIRLGMRGAKKVVERVPHETLPEDELIEATVEAFKRMLTEKNEFLNKLMDSIQSEVTVKPDRSLYDIEEELDALQLQLISRTYSKEDYDDLVEKIYTLKDEKEHFLHEEAGKENHCKNLKAIEEFIHTQDLEDFDFDEKLVRQFIDKILILDKEIEVTFKTGASVRVMG